MQYPSITSAPKASPARTMGMSPEYSQELFTNLQSMGNRAGAARRQSMIDNTSRFPGMAGVQQAQLGQIGRDTADQAMNNGMNVALQGAQAGREDRRTYEERDFTAQQNELTRLLQQLMQQRGFDFTKQQTKDQQDFDNGNFWRDAGVGALSTAGGTLFGMATGGV